MFLIFLIFSLGVHSQTLPRPHNSGWNLILEENFDGPINSKLWNTKNDDLLEITTEGRLKIRSIFDSQNDQWRSGALNTKDKFKFKYGLIETKIHLPSQDGNLPRFLLKSHGPHPYVDIDLYKQEKRLDSFTHAVNWYWDRRVIPKFKLKRSHHLKDEDQTDVIITMIWKPYEVIFYVDGEEIWKKFIQVKFMKDIYLEIYGLLDKSIKKDFEGEWSIDFIKVYQRR